MSGDFRGEFYFVLYLLGIYTKQGMIKSKLSRKIRSERNSKMHRNEIRNVIQWKQRIKEHASIGGQPGPAGYYRLIPVMLPNGTGGTVRTGDTGEEGGRCQGSITAPISREELKSLLKIDI